jgi:NAD(P)-dependent dehydrogenase (short-subunit alcohol dehydrogenase family)
MKDKIAMLTGGAGGICSEVALHFLERGAQVVALDIDASRLRALSARAGETSRLMLQRCDVTDVGAVESSVREICKRFGHIDVLVNGVGGSNVDQFHALSVEDWKREIETNLGSAFYASRTVLPIMREQRSGSIINFSSVNALVAFGNPAYSAAKAGLLSLTRSIAVEYGSSGIRCNALCLGTIRTRGWQGRLDRNPRIFEQLAPLYSVGGVADPLDLIAIVDLLAGDGARFLNGSIIVVDGGLTSGIPGVASAFTQHPF